MTDADRAATITQKKVAEIGPLLHGLGPDLQSAILADLVALWLAGHVIFDPKDGPLGVERKQTDSTRELVLADWLDLVRDLVPVNEKIILERVRKTRH